MIAVGINLDIDAPTMGWPRAAPGADAATEVAVGGLSQPKASGSELDTDIPRPSIPSPYHLVCHCNHGASLPAAD